MVANACVVYVMFVHSNVDRLDYRILVLVISCRSCLCVKLVLNSYINMWLKLRHVCMCFGKVWKRFYKTWLPYSNVSKDVPCSTPLFITKISKFGKTQNMKVLDWRVICAWAQTGGHSDIRVKSYDHFTNSARCWWTWVLHSDLSLQIWSIKCGSELEFYILTSRSRFDQSNVNRDWMF